MITLMIELIPTSIQQGLILAIVALGITIPFKLLNFPDLTAEGAYPLGGAVCASLLLYGIDPYLATLLATLAGGLMGMGTALIHLRFKVNTLLAGIILSTMTYSINLRLLGKPNVALFDINTLFSSLPNLYVKPILLLIIALVIIVFLSLYLLTEKGLRLRAVGLNPLFAEKQGVNLSQYIFLGLFLGNALSSLAGSMMVQIQQYADIGMGIGIVIHALAALMIGESLIGTQSLLRQIFAPLVGALIYQQIQGLAICAGLAPSDLKLITGAIVLIVLGYKQILQRESHDSPI